MACDRGGDRSLGPPARVGVYLADPRVAILAADREVQMKLKTVDVPSIVHPIRPSPGFAKKRLSDYALDLMGLCGYGCRYCSSNLGNYLRINQSDFANLTEEQLGQRILPAEDPDLTFRWPDVLERLERTLATKQTSWGAGRTVVFSMLTDGFSPSLVADGTTRRALDLVLERTSFRIRILTKNACVGLSKDWIRYFLEHADRFVVGLSIGSIDDAWSKRVEIHTSPPSQRLRALRALQDVEVPTYGMLCPVFPGALERLPVLVDRIRPETCETIWAEPYNDRSNWRHVRAGYDEDAPGYWTMTSIFEDPSHCFWSMYAIDLFLALRERAEAGGWLDKLVYLLYEDKIQPMDVDRLGGSLRGICLQSAPSEEGFSRNPAFAALQKEEIRAKS
jgi:DNA repair photolyase